MLSFWCWSTLDAGCRTNPAGSMVCIGRIRFTSFACSDKSQTGTKYKVGISTILPETDRGFHSNQQNSCSNQIGSRLQNFLETRPKQRTDLISRTWGGSLGSCQRHWTQMSPVIQEDHKLHVDFQYLPTMNQLVGRLTEQVVVSSNLI